MPVHDVYEPEAAWSRFERLSASSMNVHATCPRLWWHRRVDQVRPAFTPAMAIGSMLEEAVARVFRASPMHEGSEAPHGVLKTPLRPDGRPESKGVWPVRNLLPVERWPTTRETLEEWAGLRLEIHLKAMMPEARMAWESNANRQGNWESLDIARISLMGRNAISLHLDELQHLVDDPSLSCWQDLRDGVRHPIPAPDGWSPDVNLPSEVCSATGWLGAWFAGRPWFVDPDAALFSMTSVHPDAWFAGEFDFVYRWDEAPSIVDLKASDGSGDFGRGYPNQLIAYAWLWRETHDGQTPISLRIWYLDGPQVKIVPILDDTGFEAWAQQAQDLHRRMFDPDRSISQFPAEPTAMVRFQPGGVGEVQTDENRCDRCDARMICERGRLQVAWPESPVLETGHWKTFDEFRSRWTAAGRAMSLSSLHDRWPEFSLKHDEGHQRVFVRQGGPEGLQEINLGEFISISDVRVEPRYRGPVIIADNLSTVHRNPEPDLERVELSTFQMRHSVHGIVVSLTSKLLEYDDGRTNPMWSARLADASGTCEVIAFGDDVPKIAPSIRRGDHLMMHGIWIGERFGKPQIRLDRSSNVMVI